MENKGVEFTLNTVNVKNDNFNWNTNFNISFNKSKINALYYMPIKDEVPIEGIGNKIVRFTKGQPLSVFYGYKMRWCKSSR